MESNKPENNRIVPEFFDLRIKGKINDNFYYSAYHHLVRPISKNDPLSATDWVYLGYKKNGWGFEIGKMQMENGGFEYDEAPLNMYTHGLYWENYAFAFSYGLNFIKYWEKDRLAFQLFATPKDNPEILPMKSLSLCWKGTHGFWESKYSVNAIDPLNTEPLYAMTFGNSFTFGNFNALLDLVLRAPGEAYSLMGKLSYNIAGHLKPFVKLNLDHTYGNPDDILVPDGSEYTELGAGLEYFPIKNNRNVRFHLLYVYTDYCLKGKPVLERSFFNFGLTFNMHLSGSGR